MLIVAVLFFICV